MGHDWRYFLVKAQEAEALADAALSSEERAAWENIGKEYRWLADSMNNGVSIARKQRAN